MEGRDGLVAWRGGFREIVLEAGYTSPSHFAQVFRRVVGVTPTQYRDRQ